MFMADAILLDSFQSLLFCKLVAQLKQQQQQQQEAEAIGTYVVNLGTCYHITLRSLIEFYTLVNAS